MNLNKLPKEQHNRLNEAVLLALQIMNDRGFELKVAGKIAAKQLKYKPLGHVYAALEDTIKTKTEALK